MYRATIVKALLKGEKALCGRFVPIHISLNLPAGQRCTHRPHRWEERGERAGAGRRTMETSKVRFFCQGKRKEPRAPSSSEAQRSAPQSRLCHPGELSLEETCQQPSAPCRKDKDKTHFLPVVFIHAVELRDERRQRPVMDPPQTLWSPPTSFRVQCIALCRRKENGAKQPHDMTPK